MDDGHDVKKYDNNLVHPDYARGVYLSFAITAASVTALFSRYEAVKIVGLTIVTDVVCSILNHMNACRDCIEYFTTDGKFYEKLNHRLVRSLNPDLNALIWGMDSSQLIVSAVAGFFLAGAAREHFSKMPFQVTTRQLAPCMAIIGLFTTLMAHMRSRSARDALDPLAQKKHSGVSATLQMGWEACTVRGETSYCGTLLGYHVLMMIILAGRAGIIKL